MKGGKKGKTKHC